jgi:hemerythrin
MAIIWRKEFETGNPTIDSQHKQLVEMYNRFMKACAYDKSIAELEEMLRFICKYTVDHFIDEEVWQQRIKYPEFKKHKQVHDSFKQSIFNVQSKFKREGASCTIVAALSKEIGEWLINHIFNEDLKVAAYSKSE